jgi:hypothetical protein
MVADVKAATKAFTPEAVTTLVEVMQSAKAPAGARVSAAIAILDRGWGKPAQAPTGAGGGDVVIRVSGPLVHGFPPPPDGIEDEAADYGSESRTLAESAGAENH